MINEIWQENYKITSFLVNLRGRAGLYAILNLIQDVGWQHAMNLGVRLPVNQGWVFTRQKLTMQDWPAWKDEVTIKTWLREPGANPFLLRDYEIFVGDQKKGECTSTFTVFDTVTRKMVAADWSHYPKIWRSEDLHTTAPAKIPVASDVEELTQFQVRNSDIDLNNHVNNTKYAQWVLDAIPIDILRKGTRLHGYEVNFLAETKTGDVIRLQKAKSETKEGELTIVQFQGIRSSDSKPAFTALLTTSPEPEN